MKLRSIGLLLSCLGLLGCTTGLHDGPKPVKPEPVEPEPPPDTRPTVEPHRLVCEAPLDLEKACAGWQWVGIKTHRDSACPSPSDSAEWTVRHVFRPETEQRQDYIPQRGAESVDSMDKNQIESTAIPPGLRSFCLYQHGGRGDEGALQALVVSGELARLDKDCAAVAPAADGDLLDLTWPLLQERFYQQAGGTFLPTPTLEEPAKARLVLIDTQPTGEGIPTQAGNSRHGYSLAHMVRQLVCNRSRGSCAVDVRTRLALPLVNFDPDDFGRTDRDEVKGGFLGSLIDLAQAVRYEVMDRHPSKEQKLILNLSVGWDGKRFSERYPGTLEADMCSILGNDVKNDDPTVDGSTLAVFCALQDAACRGALTFAAAGNRSGGPSPTTGPLYPAAWEAHPVPNQTVCEALAGHSLEPLATSIESMVYAVGGVNAQGVPIFNSRKDSLPGLVAYADHAVVEDFEGRPTALLTGTSVATAVVSATAAAACRYESGRSELVAAMQASGYTVNEQRGFPGLDEEGAIEGSTAVIDLGVKWISLCRAVESSCADDRCVDGYGCSVDRECRASVACGTWPRAVGDSPGLRAQLDTFVPAERLEGSTIVDSLGRFDPVCSSQEIHFDSQLAVPASLCPFEQFHSLHAHPWTSPQPTDDPCDPCSANPNDPPPGAGLRNLMNSYRFLVQVATDWPQDLELKSTTLHLGSTSKVLSLKPLRAGDRLEISNIECVPEDCARAHLTFETKLGSIESPVLLVN